MEKQGYIIIACIVVAGTLFAGNYPGTPSHAVETEVIEPMSGAIQSNDQAVMYWAEVFTERLDELDQIPQGTEVDIAYINGIRHDINTAFNNTYRVMNQLEEDGFTEGTERARNEMQNAIQQQLTRGEFLTPELYKDLDMYSRLLTESRIQVALLT